MPASVKNRDVVFVMCLAKRSATRKVRRKPWELPTVAVTCTVTYNWTIKMTTLRERYCAAQTFDQFLAGVEENRDLWLAIARRADTPDEFVARVEATRDKWHLLVLAEDWCGDAVNVLPFVAKLADAASNLDLRILGRDANPDLRDAHLTGNSQSIPVVILLDADFKEQAWWGPRPSELQEWVIGAGSSMPKAERYRDIRRWYVQDRGVAVVSEIVAVIENAWSEDVAA